MEEFNFRILLANLLQIYLAYAELAIYFIPFLYITVRDARAVYVLNG
jgi:hypothetical protein